MKRLTLVRHAKSDWKIAGLKDFDRPLSRRG
jgi:phosphohistidine phosphatase